LFRSIIGRFFDFLVARSHRNSKPVQRRAPLSRLNKELPWTMRELHPQVSDVKGRSDNHYGTFDLIFEQFCVQFVLRGNDLDEIRIAGRGESNGTRIDHVQATLALRAGRKGGLQPLILDYSGLDSFLKENHEALNELYVHTMKDQGR
jgi:hypothetical protein